MRVAAIFRILAILWLFSIASTHAATTTLFEENFEGYTSFPTLVATFTGVPAGHPTAGTVQERINPGIPKLSEGAQGVWYGARFATGTGTIDSDLSVQNYGSINRPDDPNRNYTHTARFEDDAGLAFRVSTAGYTNVQLSFAWRTYNVESTDVLRVGYRTSNPGFGTCAGEGTAGCFATLTSGAGAWANWTGLTLSDASPKGNSNNWVLESFALPANQNQLWVAFWLDDGAGDIGKIDNIRVFGQSVLAIPEPSTAWFLLSGLIVLGAATRWRARQTW